MVVSHDVPSEALRLNWSSWREEAFSRITSEVADGSSDGSDSLVPLDICACRAAIRLRLDCRLRRLEACTVCCVTRPSMLISPRFRCG